MCQKSLVRALVKFVKFMHDNNQTTKVAKGVSSKLQHTAHVQASGTQVWNRQIKPSWPYKGFIIKFNGLKCDFFFFLNRLTSHQENNGGLL